MARQTDCLACESGDCLEHGEGVTSPPPDAPGPRIRGEAGPDEIREELRDFRRKVARSVKRLNRKVREARQEREEAPVGVEPPAVPPTPPKKRMTDLQRLGLGVFRSCKRK